MEAAVSKKKKLFLDWSIVSDHIDDRAYIAHGVQGGGKTEGTGRLCAQR